MSFKHKNPFAPDGKLATIGIEREGFVKLTNMKEWEKYKIKGEVASEGAELDTVGTSCTYPLLVELSKMGRSRLA
jgi:hypothetical protein